MQDKGSSQRLPGWFRIAITSTGRSSAVRNVVQDKKLHTVCSSAGCPNRAECWNAGTATFMILGNSCTRDCRFCSVPKGNPSPVDEDEPERVAQAVLALKLRYSVITSVTRDDLPDGGAHLFACTINAIRSFSPGCRVEVLIPDLRGKEDSLKIVLAANPDILNHNIETVPSLYPSVRPRAQYGRSITLLERARQAGAVTKTGIMLGLGEETPELMTVLEDLRRIDCQVLTLGQYLQPGKSYLPVRKFYHPDEFAGLRRRALELGFRTVIAGPLVRSSYHAEKYS
jgi:lipoic acid synthetase